MSDDRAQAHWALAEVLEKTDLQAFIVDRAGRIAYVTPRMNEVFAGPGGCLVSLLLDSVFSPRNPEWLSSDIRKKAAAGCWTGDAVLRKHDGSECWVHMQVCRLPDSDPDGGLLAIVEDVTERVDIMNTLMRRAQELYDRNWELEAVGKLGRLLLANTDLDSRLNAVVREAVRAVRADEGMLFIWDRHAQRLVCRAVGAHLIPKSLVGFSIGPDEQSLALDTIRTRKTCVVEDLTSQPFVLKELIAKCRLRSMLSVPIVAGDDAFGVLMMAATRKGVFTSREVTLAQIVTNYAAFAIYNAFLGEDVVLSRAYWQRTLDAIEDPVAVIDPGGTVLRVNEPLARLLGTSVPSLVGEDCSKLHPELDARLLAQVVEGGRPRSFGDETIGGEVCEVSAFPLMDPSGRADAVVFHGKMITKERRLRDEFRRASRLASVGELLAGTAHSFGNVLMAIEGTLEAARSSPAEGAADRIEQALTHAAKGAEIVRRLLSFSQGVEEAPRSISLSDVVDAALALCRAHPSTKRRKIANLVPPDLPDVEARSGPLQEVILNLVLNAVQATDPGGKVTIEADVDESTSSARVLVTDTGCGMSLETLDHIFEPFFSTKGGTGLGLSTSAAAIHRMGGAITVESEPGKGTVFTVRLKLKDRKAAQQARAA